MIFSLLQVVCFSKSKDKTELTKITNEIIEIIKEKKTDAFLKYIPDINIEVWNNKFMTKEEIESDFDAKGRIFTLIFCSSVVGETEPLCIRESLNANNIMIKKIQIKEKDQMILAEVFLTWGKKEKEKSDIYNITSYFDKFTFIKIDGEWFLYNFKVWEGQ
jgi:hypothetical protein